MTRKKIVGACAAAALALPLLALLAWGGSRLLKAVSPASASASRLPVSLPSFARTRTMQSTGRDGSVRVTLIVTDTVWLSMS